MRNKVALLVDFSFRTRIIVEEDKKDSIEDIIGACRPKMLEKVNMELGENLEEYYEDTEVPYDPDFDDEAISTPNIRQEEKLVTVIDWEDGDTIQLWKHSTTLDQDDWAICVTDDPREVDSGWSVRGTFDEVCEELSRCFPNILVKLPNILNLKNKKI